MSQTRTVEYESADSCRDRLRVEVALMEAAAREQLEYTQGISQTVGRPVWLLAVCLTLLPTAIMSHTLTPSVLKHFAKSGKHQLEYLDDGIRESVRLAGFQKLFDLASLHF